MSLKHQYSANSELRELTDRLGFSVDFFDDPPSTSDIRLFDRNCNGEIDAILCYKNLVCTVSITSTANENNIIDEIRHFYEKFNVIKNYKNLKLELVFGSKSTKAHQRLAQNSLGKIKNNTILLGKDHYIVYRKIFFAPNVRIDEALIDSYIKKGVIIIDKDIFDYFLSIYQRLTREYLFYHFIHFLGVRKIDFNKKTVSGSISSAKSQGYDVIELPLEQGKIDMYSCSLRAEDIESYITVLRMAHKYDKKGFQRMVRSNRLDKINQDYLSHNYTFPNNIIIALNPELYHKKSDFLVTDRNRKKMCFIDEYNSLIIIDGQHRFFSLIKGQKQDRPILITFLFFRTTKEAEKYLSMEKIFYRINKTQERIDPNLSFAIKARVDPQSEEAFWYPVFTKLDKQGFFSHRFSFRESSLRDPREPKSIVSVITYGGVLRLNNDRKRVGTRTLGLNQFYTGSRVKKIRFATNLLNNYFEIIEKEMATQNVAKNSLNIREIGALIRLLRQFILSNPKAVKTLGSIARTSGAINPKIQKDVDYFAQFIKNIPFKDIINLTYPASNWAAIEGYILKKIHNQQPTFGNIKLLSKKGLDIYKLLP